MTSTTPRRLLHYLTWLTVAAVLAMAPVALAPQTTDAGDGWDLDPKYNLAVSVRSEATGEITEGIGQVTVEIDESDPFICTHYSKVTSKEPFAATLTPAPASGFEFVGWAVCRDECEDLQPSTSLTVQVNCTAVSVKAYFSQIAPPTPPRYSLEVSVEPTDAGDVVVDGVTAPVYPCTKTQNSPFNGILEAVPAEGYAFANWSGDIPESTDNPVEVAVAEDGETIVAIANFVPHEPQEPVQRKGDFNADDVVDLPDFIAFAQAYGSGDGAAGYNIIGDFNEDGVIDLTDFVDFAAVYGT